MRTTFVSFEQFSDIEFEDPATYYIRTALGYVYMHTRDRKKAVDYIKKEYGGIYEIRTSKTIKSKPKYDGFDVTARG